jgi:hypothetical protein
MEMLKRGMMPPTQETQWRGATRVVQPGTPVDPQVQLRRGIGTTCIGVALLIGLSFIGYSGEGTFRLGPWLIGGLVPMFVGIAQIINAMIAGATFPSQATRMPGSGAPPPPPSGPYSYRPGSTEELPRTKPPQAP